MDLSKCTKEITKVGENHVIVTYSLFTSEGDKIIVETKEYGDSMIAQEKKSAQDELDRLNAIKADVKTLDVTIAQQQKKLDDVVAIETEMKKVL